jgi:hypothetical protein
VKGRRQVVRGDAAVALQCSRMRHEVGVQAAGGRSVNWSEVGRRQTLPRTVPPAAPATTATTPGHTSPTAASPRTGAPALAAATTTTTATTTATTSPPSGARHTVLMRFRSLLNSMTASTDQRSTASMAPYSADAAAARLRAGFVLSKGRRAVGGACLSPGCASGRAPAPAQRSAVRRAAQRTRRRRPCRPPARRAPWLSAAAPARLCLRCARAA